MNNKKTFFSFLTTGEKVAFVSSIFVALVFITGFIYVGISLSETGETHNTFLLVMIIITLIPAFIGRKIRMRGIRRMYGGSEDAVDLQKLQAEERLLSTSSRWMGTLIRITLIFLGFSFLVTVAVLVFIYFAVYR